MEPTTLSTENWTDLIGAVIIGPIVHGLIVVLGKFWIFQNEDLAKGVGVFLCFLLMWLFSTWMDPTMTPKMLIIAGLAAWGAASGTKLGVNVGKTVIQPRTGSAPPSNP